MKHFPIFLVLGLVACLLTACGVKNDAATAEESATVAVDPDAPLIPLSVGEAPITVLTNQEYPDAIMADVVLRDLSNEDDYNLEDYALDGFTVCSGCDYRLSLTMHSDGDDIKDIKLTVDEPERAEDGRVTIIWLYAWNRTTTQTLMIARVILFTDSGAPTLELSKDGKALCEGGVYLGDLTNEPTEISFDFHVE